MILVKIQRIISSKKSSFFPAISFFLGFIVFYGLTVAIGSVFILLESSSRSFPSDIAFFLGIAVVYGIIAIIGSVLMLIFNLIFWKIYQKFQSKFIIFFLIVLGLFVFGLLLCRRMIKEFW